MHSTNWLTNSPFHFTRTLIAAQLCSELYRIRSFINLVRPWGFMVSRMKTAFNWDRRRPSLFITVWWNPATGLCAGPSHRHTLTPHSCQVCVCFNVTLHFATQASMCLFRPHFKIDVAKLAQGTFRFYQPRARCFSSVYLLQMYVLSKALSRPSKSETTLFGPVRILRLPEACLSWSHLTLALYVVYVDFNTRHCQVMA